MLTQRYMKQKVTKTEQVGETNFKEAEEILKQSYETNVLIN